MDTTLGPIAAIVFDMDGVLLDTEPHYEAAMAAACAGLGYGFTHELHISTIGTPLEDTHAILRKAFGTGFPVERFEQDWRRNIVGRLSGRVPLKPGVRRLLSGLNDRSLPVAVATSTNRAPATALLTNAGLIAHFDTLVTRDDVTNGKPHPEPFLLAAERLGVEPQMCLAIEDSFNGIRSAHSAGMKAIMVPDVLEPNAEMAELSAAIIASLDALRVDLLGLE